MTQRGAARPAYEQVADEIRRMILSGELRPGDRLPIESEMADRYDVSRSTIREALRSLTSQSLVVTTRGVTGGSFVTLPEADTLTAAIATGLDFMACAEELDIGDLLEARELLEVPASRLAAKRRSPEHLENLSRALTEEATGEPGATFESSKSFHVVILEASGNRLLEVMTRPVFSVLRTRFLRDQAPSEFWGRVHREHQRIANAIEVGDVEAAGEEMRRHLKSLRTTYASIDRRQRAR